MIYPYNKIIYFETKDAYAICTKPYKFIYTDYINYLGVFENKNELKAKYPNTSILLSDSCHISKFFRFKLKHIYRKEKIYKFLNN